MRSIVRCPACQTQFLATEEQLHQHEGKVRCGQCMHIFDAKAQIAGNLTDAPAAAPETLPPQAGNGAAIEAVTSNLTQAPVPHDKDSTNAINRPFELNSPTSVQGGSHERDAIAGHESALTRHPRRLAWLLATLMLVLAAGLQSVYYLRDHIAIALPQLKPYLEQACERLHCTISLPKHIELIVIDDSDMQEDESYAGLMQLSCSLINKATFNQAYPNLEITLTNTNDEAVLRKTLTPREYLPADKDISTGFAAEAEIKIKLAIATQDTAVAGYRLYVTY